MRAIFLADGNIFTTGFSRMSERQLALWKSVRHRSRSFLILKTLIDPVNNDCRGLLLCPARYLVQVSSCFYFKMK